MWGSSPGCRLAGVQRVYARTGRRVTLRQAVLRAVVERAPRLIVGAVVRRVRAPAKARAEQRRRELAQVLSVARAQYLQDSPDRSRAIRAIRERYPPESQSCLPDFLGGGVSVVASRLLHKRVLSRSSPSRPDGDWQSVYPTGHGGRRRIAALGAIPMMTAACGTTTHRAQ